MRRWFRSLLAELLPSKVKTDAMERQPHIDERESAQRDPAMRAMPLRDDVKPT